MVNREPIYDFPTRLSQDDCSTIELFCQEYAMKIENPYTLDGFMQYVQEAFAHCKEEVTIQGCY